MIESEVFKRYQLPIEELRPKIIDTIVEVYGKRHRAQIEDRLNNLYINSYVTAEDVQNDYNTKNSHFVSILSVKFLRKIGMEVSKETEDKVYENNLINDTLSFNDYKFIINGLSQVGIKKIKFTGGEPLIMEKFFHLMIN